MELRSFAKSLLPDRLLVALRERRDYAALSALARDQWHWDRAPLPQAPSHEDAIAAMLAWLGDAQDHSASADGGFARHFDPNLGWAPSYPETTGYIVPTLLEEGVRRGDNQLIARARRATDWLCAIQFDDGGFQGGMVDELPKCPVTFNTGQILLGLVAAAAHFDSDRYREAAARAAQWLADTLDADGAWRRFGSPFTESGEKAYETHVSWGLLEADRLLPGRGFGDAAQRQIRWAIGKQDPATGWFCDNCLTHPETPSTHTIGYVLRGIVEGYRHTPDPLLLAAANRTARAIVRATAADGRLAGRFDRDWTEVVSSVCLTGSAQIAHSLLLLDGFNGNRDYQATAVALNDYVRRTIRLDGPSGIRGGVKGSHPIDGDYLRYQYINWAPKFAIDSFRLELARTLSEGAAGPR